MNFHTLKKAAAITAALTLICPLERASAYDKIGHITILGDSISSGYALDESDKNYGTWLGDYYNAEVENFAVMGHTTYNLLEVMQEREVVEAVEKTDLVCVSIGANDVMDAVFDDLKASSLLSADAQTEKMKDAIMKAADKMKAAADEASRNIGVISERLHAMNPEAKLVFQTVYIPFETDIEEYKTLITTLSIFSGIYLAPINAAVRTDERVIFADIQSKFRGMCPSLTNISRFDIHPNKLGHLVIAEEIVQKVGIEGEYSVIKSGFDAIASEDTAFLDETLLSEFEQLGEGQLRPAPTEPPTEPETQPITTEAETIKKKDYSVWLAVGGAGLLLTAGVIIMIKNRKGKI